MFTTLAIIYTDDIFINNKSNTKKNQKVYNIKYYNEIQSMKKIEFEQLLRDSRVVIIDSRLVDIICTISYYSSMKDYEIELLILDTEKYNHIYTFYQYMNTHWIKNRFRMFHDKQL